jgi:hypothetical protein
MALTGKGFSVFGNDITPDVLADLYPVVSEAVNATKVHADARGSPETAPSKEDWARYEIAMGSVATSYGFCSKQEPLSFDAKPGYYEASNGSQIPAHMTYCACQNSAIMRPGCHNTSCIDSVYSYKNEQVINQLDFGTTECPKLTINDCQQIIYNKGNNNNIEANQNEVCGGTQNVFATNIRQRPYSTVALCVMVIAFILLGLSLRPKPSAASRLPPPEQMLLLSAAGP